MNLIPTADYQKMLAQLPIVCVDVVIVYEGKCLLLLRDNEPAKNTYWFPGGRIYKNESIKDAALRKAKEETNLDCTFERIISAEESIFERTGNMTTIVHTVNICCLMSLDTHLEIKLDGLHTAFKWIEKIDPKLHPAVINPLQQLNFSF